MELIREIRELDSDTIILRVPKKFRKRKVEIVVSSIEKSGKDQSLKKQLQAINELNGLISDLGKEKLEEFDRIISQRITFRKNPLQL
jgi:hypothetical protein